VCLLLLIRRGSSAGTTVAAQAHGRGATQLSLTRVRALLTLSAWRYRRCTRWTCAAVYCDILFSTVNTGRQRPSVSARQPQEDRQVQPTSITLLALPREGGRADSRIPCTQARALPRAPVPPPPAAAVAHSAWGAALLPAGTLPRRDHAVPAPPQPAREQASGVPRWRLRAWGVEEAARSRAQQHVLTGSEPHGPSVAHADNQLSTCSYPVIPMLNGKWTRV
jgi:hypothetical protein